MVPMTSRPRTLLLAALALLAAGVLVETLHVSETERVEAAWDDVRAAVEQESLPALEDRLTADFSWSGPRPVGVGERADVAERFGAFWTAAETISVAGRGSPEVTVAGSIATVVAPTVVTFRVNGDQLSAWRVDATLTFDRIGDRWVLARVEVTGLRPGVF